MLLIRKRVRLLLLFSPLRGQLARARRQQRRVKFDLCWQLEVTSKVYPEFTEWYRGGLQTFKQLTESL